MVDVDSARTTVVIPVWDAYAGNAVEEALASLRAQDVSARIVLVDNASDAPLPDAEGIEIVRSARRLSLGGARNLGLTHVQTQFVVAWDADDLMLPGTLARLEREIEATPELAAFGMSIVEKSGIRHRWPRRWVGPLTRAPTAFSLLHCVWSILPTTGSTIMRTELIRAGGGYGDAESGEDWVAGVSLAFRGRIGWSEQPGRIYSVHEQSVWSRRMTVRHQWRHAKAVRKRIRTDRGIPGWVRPLLPLIAIAQWTAILGHTVVAAGRRRRASLRSPRQ